jgi:hypothetical protein
MSRSATSYYAEQHWEWLVLARSYTINNKPNLSAIALAEAAKWRRHAFEMADGKKWRTYFTAENVI